MSWWERMRRRWAPPETGEGNRVVQEAQDRLDRTRDDDKLVEGLLAAGRRKRHDYISEEMQRTFRRARG